MKLANRWYCLFITSIMYILHPMENRKELDDKFQVSVMAIVLYTDKNINIIHNQLFLTQILLSTTCDCAPENINMVCTFYKL